MSVSDFLWAKFWVSFWPLFFLAIMVTAVSCAIIQFRWQYNVLACANITLLTAAVTGLGVGLGAAYPRFKVENVARIPTGYGGMIYMVLGMALVLVGVGFNAVPVYLYTLGILGRTPGWSGPHFWAWTAGASSVLVLVAATIVPMVLGGRALSAREDV
jgi:ABC-2 type transport system permease protein